jgi:hypothetical protein
MERATRSSVVLGDEHEGRRIQLGGLVVDRADSATRAIHLLLYANLLLYSWLLLGAAACALETGSS